MFDPSVADSHRSLSTVTDSSSFLNISPSSDLSDGLSNGSYSLASSSSLTTTAVQIPVIPSSRDIDLQLQTPDPNITRLNGGAIEISGSVNRRSDIFYRWETSTVNVSVTDIPSGQNIDLQLLDSDGEEQAVSANPGNAPESLNYANLPFGVYYIRVLNRSNTSASTFVLRASNNTPPNLLVRDNNIVRRLNNTLTFSDRVNDQDTSDIFRFTLPSAGAFQVNLVQFDLDPTLPNPNPSATPEIHVRLIQQLNQPGNFSGSIDDNEVLYSDIDTNTILTAPMTVFTTPTLPIADYWIQVYIPSGSPPISYSLQLTRLPSNSRQATDVSALLGLDLTDLTSV